MRYLIIFSAIAFCLNASVHAQTSELDLQTYTVQINTAPPQGAKTSAFFEAVEKGKSNNRQPLGLYLFCRHREPIGPGARNCECDHKKNYS